MPNYDFNEVLSDIDGYSSKYSEGDPNLKATLINLWKNNYVTVACCKGHDETKSGQYIAFTYNKSDYLKYLHLVSSLDKKAVRISFGNRTKHLVSIKPLKSNVIDIYDNINNSINLINEDETLKKIFEYILRSDLYEYLSVQVIYKNYQIKELYVSTFDKEIINELINKYTYIERFKLYRFKII